MKKTKHISIRVNPKLAEKIKQKAEKEGMSYSEALRFALRKWSESNE